MQKTTAIATGSSVAVAFSGLLIYRSYLRQLYARFPNYDQKIVRQAFRRMLGKALAGRYEENLDRMSDLEMDALFRREVEALLDL